MDAFVFTAVLFAAACHAGWNATIKRGLDPLATTVLISIGAAIVAAVFAAGRRLAGRRRMAMVRRVGVDPSRLFRRADRKLPRRRHGTGLSDRARIGATDDGDRDHRVRRRAARPCSAGAASSCWRPGSCCCRCAAAAILRGSIARRSASPCSPRSRSAPIRWWTAWARGSPAAPTLIRSRCSSASVRSW